MPEAPLPETKEEHASTKNVQHSEQKEPQPKVEDKAARINKILRYAVPILVVLLALGLWALLTFNWNAWEAGRSSHTTDDATVEADIIPLSTRSIGTIDQVNIE